MTSSNGNIFRVTGHLWGEFTGLRWIPRTKASDAELWYFLWCKRLSKHSRGWWFETLSHPLWRHRNGCRISVGSMVEKRGRVITVSHCMNMFFMYVYILHSNVYCIYELHKNANMIVLGNRWIYFVENMCCICGMHVRYELTIIFVLLLLEKWGSDHATSLHMWRQLRLAHRISGTEVLGFILSPLYHSDVIMTMMASQITSLTVVYSIAYWDADQRKHQSSASLTFVRGIHRDRWIPRTKGQ